jgi:hypothetical protein
MTRYAYGFKQVEKINTSWTNFVKKKQPLIVE